MDQQSNSGPSILEIVMGGIAAVNPRQFRHGPAKAEHRDPGTESLGIADDYVKRIHCFHSSQVDRGEALAAEIKRLLAELLGEKVPTDMGEYLVELTSGSKAAAAVRIRDLMNERSALEDIIAEAHGLFWREAKRRNPKLKGYYKVTLHRDWSFSASDDVGSDVSDILSRALGLGLDDFTGSGGEGILGLGGLAERLKKRHEGHGNGRMPSFEDMSGGLDGLLAAMAEHGGPLGSRMARGL